MIVLTSGNLPELVSHIKSTSLCRNIEYYDALAESDIDSTFYANVDPEPVFVTAGGGVIDGSHRHRI
ncbi:hypothetical protein [Haloquadratum walsbyi]|uniref:Uncharacterized protein n=1 Tax=Haloquadratum walsbyi J07HQW2 TaxID=1238425 RepID=U1PPI5_9EURY|nr:hypothetical protein [Haloquadratum walsbyi]ERG94216.1 MAG: hypothetical protein J07HQW2_00650 [Haloquadratum walsbyi J07HQW2]